jgi:rhamnosyltransferase subunit B
MTESQISVSSSQVKNSGRRKRIIITTYGSYGDVHPYMAIAIELQARGHRVAMAMSEDYRPKIEAEGIEFHAIRPDAIINMHLDGPLIQALKECNRESEYAISYVLMPHVRSTYSDLKQAVAGADLLVTHHLSFAGGLVAETTGIPWVSSVLSPLSLMSAYDLPNALPSKASSYEQALALVANDMQMRYTRWNARFLSAPARQLRADLGLPPSCDPLFEGQHSPNLVLALFSSLLAAPQPDWPNRAIVTGFPFYDRHYDRKLSPELEAFLESGNPPIVFTLGSLFVWTPGNFYLESAIAAQQLGCRAVLLVGPLMQNFRSDQLPEGIIAVDYAPHSQIFPRAAAIVHHGGVGTTGQALRAGKPMLVVPHAHDQPDNAARLVRLGVARTISALDYNADRLATELKHLLFDPKYANKAAQVSQLLQKENGIAEASNAIEAYLNGDLNKFISLRSLSDS